MLLICWSHFRIPVLISCRWCSDRFSVLDLFLQARGIKPILVCLQTICVLLDQLCFNLMSLAWCPLFLFYKVTSDEILGARYEFVKESEFQCCILIYNTSEWNDHLISAELDSRSHLMENVLGDRFVFLENFIVKWETLAPKFLGFIFDRRNYRLRRNFKVSFLKNEWSIMELVTCVGHAQWR